jgi:sugar O-acyltransferase (sialic acid O-acetyltransferase NeuD family)
MNPYIILVGGGGHCKSCIDVIEQAGTFQIAGIVDVPGKLHQKILSYEIIATDEDFPRLVKEYPNFLITVGQILSPEKRITLFDNLKQMGTRFPVIVSPLAHISRHARVGEGTIVMHHALINAGACIGKNCIVNTKALIEHDAVIGDHCHISTAAVINGGAHIEKHTFIGSNVMTKEYVTVGECSIIGAGSVVTKNILQDSTVMGASVKAK